MSDKMTAKKLTKKYISPEKRPKMGDYGAALDRDLTLMPLIHRNANTPTAAQLMRPDVGIGEGSIRDKAPYMTTDDLPPNWAEIMRDEAAQGKGNAALMVALNITVAGFETLLATSPEFEEVYQRCLILSCLWWEERGRNMAMGEKGNSTIWLAHMVNKHGWNSSKSSSIQTSNSTVTSTTTNITSLNATVKRADLTEEDLKEELRRRGLSKFVDLKELTNDL